MAFTEPIFTILAMLNVIKFKSYIQNFTKIGPEIYEIWLELYWSLKKVGLA